MLDSNRIPSTGDAAVALAECNWIYLDEGDDGGVFDCDLVDIEKREGRGFDVTLLIYSRWDEWLQNEITDIEICTYSFSFSIFFDERGSTWKVDEEVNDGHILDSELASVSINQLPDFPEKMWQLIDRDFNRRLCCESIGDVDLSQAADTVRPYLEGYKSKHIGNAG